MEPSGANKGFFQRQPVLKNQFYDDVSVQRIVKLFLPSSVVEQVAPEIAQLAEDVLSPQIFDWITDAERNLPYIRGSGRDAFGKPRSELVVGEGWTRLQEFGFQKGVVAYNYDTDLGPLTRIVQLLRVHLWEGSCANTLCPAAMQDGATRLLQRHLLSQSGMDSTQRKVLQNAFDHLISRDPSAAWTSGQWMTERTGGSDVSQTETVATYSPYPSEETTPRASSTEDEDIPLGPYEINGFKWFSSATDSQMTILLAKTRPGLGVSAFFAPMRRYNPSLVSATGREGGLELNGVNISRLKNKFGTQSLPTAELELAGMRGWLIGQEGKGIQEISTILNITRVHSTVAALGYLGRAIGIAKAYALVREVGVGKGNRVPLSRHPLHMRTLAATTGDYHSLMLLVFYTLHVLGLDERGSGASPGPGSPMSAVSPPPQHVGPLLRVLSSLHKAYVCETAVPLVYGCMAALGGVGYLVNAESEHMNVARLFRDACVLAIWEGTTDVLSSDTIRALKHPRAGAESLDALDWFVGAALGSGSGSAEADAGRRQIQAEWARLKARIRTETQAALLPEARQIVFRIAEVLIAALFAVDAKAHPGAEVEAMRRRYMAKKGFADESSGGAAAAAAAAPRQDGLDLDLAIVYGAAEMAGGLGSGSAASKL